MLLPSAACFLLGVALSVAIFASLGLEPVPANLFGFVAKGARLGMAFPIFHILWPFVVPPLAARLYASSREVEWGFGS